MKNLPIFDKEILISPAEWHSWLNHPVTQEFMSAIRRERDDWSEQQNFGDILTDAPEKSLTWYARSVGIIYGLDQALAGVGEALLVQWDQARIRKEESRRKEEEG